MRLDRSHRLPRSARSTSAIAIVSPRAGTTRDTLRETLVIDGLTLTLIDTAEEYERIASSCNGEIRKQTH